MVLNSVGLRVVRMVGVMVRIGGRGREGLGERKGSILSTVYILGVVARMIDVVCVPDRRLPSGCAGGVGIWIRSRRVIWATSTVSGACAVEAIV